MVWKIIDTGVGTAEENMRYDARILEEADLHPSPILHLYEWEGKCATHGYFVEPQELLDLDAARALGISLARRPTGGGIVFHLWDMAFSVLVPASSPEFSQNTLENYAFVNQAVLGAVKEFLCGSPPLSLIPEDLVEWDGKCRHFCMAKPTKYDVMWEGRKIAGAAQRKTRKGFLHQGTIALSMPCLETLGATLLPGSQVASAMQAHTCPLLGANPSEQQMRAAKRSLGELLSVHLSLASDKISSK